MDVVLPDFIDNVHKTLSQSLKDEIKPGSKISIAAACFSIYAYQELQNELKNIDELRFIFTSPTFVADKAKKEKLYQMDTTRMTVEEVKKEVWRYIFAYYNTVRISTVNGGLPPKKYRLSKTALLNVA